MTGTARIIVLAVAGLCVCTLAACSAESSPPPSTSPSATSSAIPGLVTLASHYGATEAWWAVLPHAQAVGLTLGRTGVSTPDPSPSAATYVVLMRGEFNDASGKPQAWAIAVPQGGDVTAVVSNGRPNVPGAEWSPLALPSP